jgi:hypothetical protein
VTAVLNGGRTTRVRGLAAWQPQSATRQLLQLVQSVLVEYAEYLPLTLRQIFYRLVGAHGYDKTERAYDRLGEHLKRARRAGLIPFDGIRDDGITLKVPLAWDGPRELVETFLDHAETFRLDRQVGQPQRRLFVIEAAGMVPQIERIGDHDPSGVHMFSAVAEDVQAIARDLGLPGRINAAADRRPQPANRTGESDRSAELRR